MTDREKLIDVLRSVCKFEKCLGKTQIVHCKNCQNGSVLADHLIANGVLVTPETGIGDLSDGYHTFNELYHHRAVLFSVICNSRPDIAWKSKLHDTGDMFEGMFIVGIETPQGQATYHYDIEPYWNMFKVKELDRAPKYDGHTPQEAIERIGRLTDRMRITKNFDVPLYCCPNCHSYGAVVVIEGDNRLCQWCKHPLDWSDTDV